MKIDETSLLAAETMTFQLSISCGILNIERWWLKLFFFLNSDSLFAKRWLFQKLISFIVIISSGDAWKTISLNSGL